MIIAEKIQKSWESAEIPACRSVWQVRPKKKFNG